MELEQRIMIAAEVARPSQCCDDCLVEHAADGGTIEHGCAYTEANNSAGELIHHDHHPVGSQDQCLAAKEIDAPQTIFGVSEEREPGRALRAGLGSVAPGEHAAHDVLV